MRILLLTHSFNSLTQRLWCELRAHGHEVSVELDIADSVAEEAIALFRPALVIAPFLKRRIPESIWRRHLCLIVHPGIVGDRGPAALDRAIRERATRWGVTVLQAEAEMDAGPVWATETFPMRSASKSSLYRDEVTAAALRAVLTAVERVEHRGYTPQLPATGLLRPALTQAERRIDWQRDDTATVLAQLHAADGTPGVLDTLFGVPCRLYDAHAAAQRPHGAAGTVVARHAGAVLRLTRDGAVWIGHCRREEPEALKLPVTSAFARESAALPPIDVPLQRGEDGDWSELRYEELGSVGYLHFDFYNGAMSPLQCDRLRAAYAFARSRPTRVLVLMGGRDFWSNGIHLNTIEAADSPAEESWRNINAIDDVARDVIDTGERLTVAALRGNAGAGGAFLALACDQVWARDGVILNPHYKNMGNLYGSEYWTYLLPRRTGEQRAREIVGNRFPLTAAQAVGLRLVDACFGTSASDFHAELARRAEALATAPDYAARLSAKQAARATDERAKPLAAYRAEELAQMQRNFFGFDPSYHVARHRFVHRAAHSWTPRHLAVHRELDWQVPPLPSSAPASDAVTCA